MYWGVTSVQPQHHLTLTVQFADGLQRTVYFKPSHLTSVFASLKEEKYFNKVFVNHGAVAWPVELDSALDAMHAEIKKHGCWVLE